MGGWGIGLRPVIPSRLYHHQALLYVSPVLSTLPPSSPFLLHPLPPPLPPFPPQAFNGKLGKARVQAPPYMSWRATSPTIPPPFLPLVLPPAPSTWSLPVSLCTCPRRERSSTWRNHCSSRCSSTKHSGVDACLGPGFPPYPSIDLHATLILPFRLDIGFSLLPFLSPLPIFFLPFLLNPGRQQ